MSDLTVHEVFGTASSCGDHPLQIEASVLDGAETLFAASSCCWADECNCDETGTVALAKLVDGRYLVVAESSDYTGHGCRCDGYADIYDTLEQAVNVGLTDEARRHYGQQVAR
jgi:hypothetical protein